MTTISKFSQLSNILGGSVLPNPCDEVDPLAWSGVLPPRPPECDLWWSWG